MMFSELVRLKFSDLEFESLLVCRDFKIPTKELNGQFNGPTKATIWATVTKLRNKFILLDDQKKI